MNRDKLFYYYKLVVVLAGSIALLLSLLQLDDKVLDWRFIILVVFCLTAASKMTLLFPRTNISLSFSDSIIFLAFLLFGGKEAVFISVLEMSAVCYALKRQGAVFTKLTIPFNVASLSIATSISWQVWTLFTKLTGFDFKPENTSNLIITLGIFAASQFITNSIFISTFMSIKNGIKFWEAWKNGGFSISVTQIAGATIAGVIFKLINDGDFYTTGITLVIFVVAYFNYRKIISDMTSSTEEAEQAQREKAESERTRAEQAEFHAAELAESLTEQERISDELQRSNDALEHAAYHDALTNLPNRAYLVERLKLLLELDIEISNKYFVLFLDLSRFKNINDSLGHTVGDKVLGLVAKRLQRIVRLEDTVARLGGDEFAIILNDLASIDDAKEYAKKILQKLTQPFALRGHKIYTSVNIGISPFNADHKKPEDILRDADIAMHHAKEKGINIGVFDIGLRSHFLESVKLEAELRFAIERNELSMYYQPLISLQDGEILGFEALLRWHHPKLGFISPARFIPVAEESGLIIPITEWILEQTTAQLAKWQKISNAYRKLIVSVNISGKHIAQDGLIEVVKQSIKNSKIKPSSLKLEITESIAMENAERTIEILTRLKNTGVQLSIDDFGTGYSSLSYLHRLPFDTLKIDRSFVYSVGENGENSGILQTIVSLAKNLKMKAIAEGIETESQLRLLRNLGCEMGQGFLMSKPLPKAEMETLLYQKSLWFPPNFLSDESETKSNHNSNSNNQVNAY